MAVTLLLVGAPGASAGGGNGLLVSNVDYNCYSLTTPNPYLEPMISAIAGWGAEGEAAVVGQPFSAQFSVGLVGRSCSGADITPTVIPPAGVRVAIDSAHPVQWRYPEEGSEVGWNTAGVRPLPLADGSVKLLADDGQGHTTWPIVNDKPPLQFLVPLVADRELRGAGSGPGQCPDGPPCAGSEAGDYLQVRVDTTIGTPNVLAPVVALFATPAPPGTGGGGGPATPGGPSTPGTPGAPTPTRAVGKLTVAKSLRAATLRRGLTLKVQAAKGAKLAVAITIRQGKKTQTIARGSATATRAGQAKVSVKPTSRGRSLLAKRGNDLKATLRLTATGKGLSTVTQTAALSIRR